MDRAAHALKSANGNVGLCHAQQLCARIETLTREEDLAAAFACAEELDAVLRAGLDALERHYRLTAVS